MLNLGLWFWLRRGVISPEANEGAEADFSKSGESRSRTVSSRWSSSSAILISAIATETASNGKMTKESNKQKQKRRVETLTSGSEFDVCR